MSWFIYVTFVSFVNSGTKTKFSFLHRKVVASPGNHGKDEATANLKVPYE
jgi:hypothetical protein